MKGVSGNITHSLEWSRRVVQTQIEHEKIDNLIFRAGGMPF